MSIFIGGGWIKFHWPLEMKLWGLQWLLMVTYSSHKSSCPIIWYAVVAVEVSRMFVNTLATKSSLGMANPIALPFSWSWRARTLETDGLNCHVILENDMMPWKNHTRVVIYYYYYYCGCGMKNPPPFARSVRQLFTNAICPKLLRQLGFLSTATTATVIIIIVQSIYPSNQPASQPLTRQIPWTMKKLYSTTLLPLFIP